jgi:hypothetical protein
MSNYLDGIEGGKHNSDNTETSISPKTFSVSISFTDMVAKNPLDAAKKACKWLIGNPTGYSVDGADTMIYDVEDETTGEKFSVDLSEDDENAVLPNN